MSHGQGGTFTLAMQEGQWRTKRSSSRRPTSGPRRTGRAPPSAPRSAPTLQRPSPAKGERLRAVGRVIRAGKKLVITAGDVFADDGGKSKHVAMITATMMVVETATGLKN